MKGFSNLLMTVSGIAVAPFLVYFLSRYITDAYPWVPFLIVLVAAAVLGVGLLRGAGAGLVVGAFAYGALLMWWHRGLDFLPHYIRAVRAPF
jgi:hypothetical protein